MAKVTTALESANERATLARRHREEANVILIDIETYDTTRLSTEDLDFIEAVPGRDYIAEGVVRHLEQIRDMLERDERRRRERRRS